MSTLLVLGNLDADWLVTLEQAAAAAGYGLQARAGEDDVPAELLTSVRAVVLGDLPGGPLLAATRLREGAHFERVALLAVWADPRPSDYVACLTAGIDDLLVDRRDRSGLRQRLDAAREAALGASRSLRRGLALAIGPVQARSSARVRALAGAGFRAQVHETTDAPWLTEPRLALVVWEPTDPASALQEIRAARQAGALCRFVLSVPDQEVAALAAECDKLDGVRVLPETSPPDGVVFLVNEMAESGVQNQRASRRRLASALVHFAAGGRTDLGLSYNVSAGGLYVRTLAPPTSGPVELSVDVAGSRATVSCELAWSRALAYDGTATAPPGFGVKIVKTSAAAQELLATLGAG